jgi:purine-nucleoside/S-methyl-5'-thioadenosine phosphorylase / adenosine deaminase
VFLYSTILRSAGFAHAFSTREAGDFAILRDPATLRANQERLAKAVGFSVDQLHQTRQVHGTLLVEADGNPSALLGVEADALVSEPATGHAVAVRVADCVPVLVADCESGRVAAIHAGWRGVEGRILAVAIDQLARRRGAGGPPAFVAAIGPCIGPCCFEVGADVAWRIAVASSVEVLRRRAGDKAWVDLRMAVRKQLEALGLEGGAIDDVPGCTRCETRFHSYRRDGDASGRLIGVIVAGLRGAAQPDRPAPPP